MESAYVCARDLVESGHMLYQDLYSLVASGQLRAFSPDGLPAIVWNCGKHDGDFPDSLDVFDMYATFNPQADGAATYVKMEKLRLLVSRMWGMDVRPRKIVVNHLPKSFRSRYLSGKRKEIDCQELFGRIDSFLLPMGSKAVANIGLTRDRHKELFLSLRFRRDEIENILREPEHKEGDARVQATNLKIIEGLMLHVGIDPYALGAAKKVLEILSDSGIRVDEKTVRERIKKIKDNPATQEHSNAARSAQGTRDREG